MGSEAEHVVKEREQRLLRLHEDFVLCIYLLKNVSNYPQRIGRTDLLTEFDESVFTGTVDCVIVCQGQGKNEKQRMFRFILFYVKNITYPITPSNADNSFLSKVDDSLAQTIGETEQTRSESAS